MDDTIPAGNPADDAATRAAVERYAAAWSRSDRDAIVACYHPAFALHYFGDNALSGDHIGKAVALAALAAFARRTRRSLVGIVAVLAGGGRGAIVARERLGEGDQAVEVERLLVYAVADGLLRECWVYDQDQRRIDRIVDAAPP